MRASATQRTRWPRRVFDGGEEPDPRFSLANERTLLAWIRTSVGLGAAGVALASFDVRAHEALVRVSAFVFILTAVVVPLFAWIRWTGTERALRHGRDLPGGLLTIAVIGSVTLACVLTMSAMVLA